MLIVRALARKMRRDVAAPPPDWSPLQDAIKDFDDIAAEAMLALKSQQGCATCLAASRFQCRQDAEAGEDARGDLGIDLVDLGNRLGDKAEACAVGPGKLHRIGHDEAA